MGIFEYIQLLDQIHHAIKCKNTGPPKVFASRLNISESTLYRIIEELRDRGAEIVFNQSRLTYYYKNEVEIKLLIKINESQEYKGGKTLDYFDTLIFDSGIFYLDASSYQGISEPLK